MKRTRKEKKHPPNILATTPSNGRLFFCRFDDGGGRPFVEQEDTQTARETWLRYIFSWVVSVRIQPSIANSPLMSITKSHVIISNKAILHQRHDTMGAIEFLPRDRQIDSAGNKWISRQFFPRIHSFVAVSIACWGVWARRVIRSVFHGKWVATVALQCVKTQTEKDI